MLVEAAQIAPLIFGAHGALCQHIKLCESNAQKKFIMQHSSQEFDRFLETPGSQQGKWRACGWILLGSVRILSLNHPVSMILYGRLAHAKLCSRFGVPGILSLATVRAASALPEPQMRCRKRS
jgi:hypothetical protein